MNSYRKKQVIRDIKIGLIVGAIGSILIIIPILRGFTLIVRAIDEARNSVRPPIRVVVESADVRWREY